jgi:hypothetical protein
MDGGGEGLITSIDVREYFQGAVQDALFHQNLNVRQETAVYLTNLLVEFVRSENLYDDTSEGIRLRPLAEMYADAVDARTLAQRDKSLRRLGDVALFIAGLFSGSLGRSLVDVDYYIAMGGSAYSFLAGSGRGMRAYLALKQVFSELSERFTEIVDVLGEVGEGANLKGGDDILRLYEIWLCTGSRRAARHLRIMGVEPVGIAPGPAH